MRLTDGVHLVASGRLGLSITHPLDCHVYLVGSSEEAVLIDSGCGLDVDALLREIDASGIPREAISRILLTHAHADHAGGAAALAESLGATVWASPVAAKALRVGDEEATGLTRARSAGIYPQTLRLKPMPEIRELTPGPGRIGGFQLEVIETPGHCAGHLTFLAKLAQLTCLFAGDVLFTRGRIVLLAAPDCSLLQLSESLRTLTGYPFDALLPGHAEFAMKGGSDHLMEAVGYLDQGHVPPFLLP